MEQTRIMKEYSPADIKAMQAEEEASDKKQKRTPEQIEAIYASGSNILVSASAGSGKTFVMVERILDQIKRGLSIDQLFISTFTVKAAGELKERLEQKLAAAIKDSQDPALKAHLAKQMAGVSSADIGTMDAFTQKILQEYGYLLDLAPNFRILVEDSEKTILKNQVYDVLFDAYMTGEQEEAFQALVSNFTKNQKGSAAFRHQVYRVYDYIQSTPDPKAWLEDIFLKGNEEMDFETARGELEEELIRDLRDLAAFLDQHLKIGDPSWVKGKYLERIPLVLDLVDQIGGRPLSDLAQEVLSISKGSGISNGTKPKDPVLIELKQAYNAEKNQLLDRARNHYAAQTTLAYQEACQADNLALLTLFRDFMLDFRQAYLDLKLSELSLEFSDVSHLAIRILKEFPDVGQAFRDKYYQVMVDEYQDTNHIQEEMLQLLSNGHNLFMVGDIKQSIYRFRQADPQIFAQKMANYQVHPEQGHLIVLKENFRSHEAVLSSTNALFKRLMDEDLGEINYNELHYLKAGSSMQLESRPDLETLFLLYDGTKEEEDSEDKTAYEDQSLDQDTSGDGDGLASLSSNQLDMVIKEIISLHEEKGVAFKDMALLVPSRTRNDLIRGIFEDHGIPIVIDEGEGSYLQALEVKVMLDTLRTIDNPLQDYPLLALLKSPMFAFDEDQLTRLSLQSKDALAFYDKIQLALSGQGEHPQLIGPDLAYKIGEFLSSLDKWRKLAQTQSLYDLIWQIYQDRLYYAQVGTMTNGAKRQANLYALTVRANAFEKSGFKGLSRFINQIEKILQVDKDLADVILEAPEDAVQLMTIHKSKGLEFDYVFLLNLDQDFNKKEESQDLILNREKGAGIIYLSKVPTGAEDGRLPQTVDLLVETRVYQTNKEALKRASLSERMRLLYVAMTRAAKKLYLVGSLKKEKADQDYSSHAKEGRLALEHRLSYKNFQDWFLALSQAFSDQDLHFSIQRVSDEDLTADKIGQLAQTSPLVEVPVQDLRQSEQIAQALRLMENVDRINQEYAAAISLPTVRTPSQLKKLYEPLLDNQDMVLMEAPEEKTVEFSLPQIGKKAKVTGAEVGSAVHALMQRIPLDQDLDEKVLTQLLEELDVREAVRKKVDLKKILAFFSTGLGLELQTNSALVRREAPFAILEKDLASGQDYVIRGIIDGFIDYDDHLVLFDYKTDRYRDPAELVARYQGQMELYSRALQAAYGKKRVESYLVLLSGSETLVVSLDLEKEKE